MGMGAQDRRDLCLANSGKNSLNMAGTIGVRPLERTGLAAGAAISRAGIDYRNLAASSDDVSLGSAESVG